MKRASNGTCKSASSADSLWLRLLECGDRVKVVFVCVEKVGGEASGQHGDANLSRSDLVVDEGAKDNVGVCVDALVNHLGGSVDLLQGHVGTPDNVEDDTFGAGDGEVEQWRRNSSQRCINCAALSLASADAHESCASVAHNRTHVGKVDVDEAGLDNDFRNAYNALDREEWSGVEWWGIGKMVSGKWKVE